MTEQVQQPKAEGFRLSPQQRNLWSHQLNDGPHTYKALAGLLLEGNLDVQAMQNAFEQLISRHEILRTRFQCLAGMAMPVQIIDERHDLQLIQEDLSQTPEKEQVHRLGAQFEDCRRMALTPEHLPVARVWIAELSTTRHILFLVLPALCADSATIKNLMHELAGLYALSCSSMADLDEPLQYADVAEWQNELLEEESKDGIQYWQQQGFIEKPMSDISLAMHVVDGARFEPRTFSLSVDRVLVQKIDKLAATRGIAASDVFLTCWQILLWRLLGQDSFVLGLNCDGRGYDELKTAIGLFEKYLPFKINLDSDQRFDELLNRTAKVAAEITERQEHFSWEKLSQLEPNRREVDFFPICFDYQDQSIKVEGAGLHFSIYTQHTCVDRFKLKLNCVRRGPDAIIEFHYDSCHLDQDLIERFGDQLQVLLGNALADPALEVEKLELLSAKERQRVLIQLNGARTDYPKDKRIDVLIDAQARLVPSQLAIISEGGNITYAELEERANQLAHHLQSLNVGPDTLVGLCVERSIEMLVGLLGILKAGGAYVPLDPAYPVERLAFMLEDTQMPVLVTQEKFKDQLPDHQAHVVCLDLGSDAIQRESVKPATSRATPQNLAYVIYTSGSTGKPKGVEITHENLVHSTTARLNYYKESPGSFILLPSFAFDSSVAGIFWTLCSGGTLVLPQERLERDADAICKLVQQHQVSHLLTLPSLYGLILSADRGNQLDTLRTAIVAGEAVSSKLEQAHAEALPNTALFNEYGPTEATVWSTVFQCQVDTRRARVPIGKPISNAQIYLLSPQMQPLPVGVSGELYVGGAGVARGYLNRPELTSERFVGDLFSETNGHRLYRTGDLGRLLPDGNIEFMGRADNQVKIRGYRIELGEIESILVQYPSVEEAAVVTREDTDGDKRLVAYVVPNDKRSIGDATRELRAFVQQKLPDYMTPSAFVVLDELPRTPNGKVDRRALPAPDKASLAADTPFEAPRNPIEEILTGIWAEVLGIEEIGIHHNFFEMGGHSILATRLASRLRETFRAEIALRTIFEAPTISDLSKALIADSENGANIEKTAAVLTELAGLSDEEVELMLEEKVASAKQVSEK